MHREDYELTEKLNYSIITMMPCVLVKVNKQHFINFVKERALFVFKANMVTLHPDWILRKYYVRNQKWKQFKEGFIDETLEEMRIINSKKLKYLYGNSNAILSTDRSLSPERRAQSTKRASVTSKMSKDQYGMMST
jgi:hypothetical protein